MSMYLVLRSHMRLFQQNTSCYPTCTFPLCELFSFRSNGEPSSLTIFFETSTVPHLKMLTSYVIGPFWTNGELKSLTKESNVPTFSRKLILQTASTRMNQYSVTSEKAEHDGSPLSKPIHINVFHTWNMLTQAPRLHIWRRCDIYCRGAGVGGWYPVQRVQILWVSFLFHQNSQKE